MPLIVCEHKVLIFDHTFANHLDVVDEQIAEQYGVRRSIAAAGPDDHVAEKEQEK